MSAAIRSAWIWSPVIARGALWVLISMGTSFLDKTADLVGGKEVHWNKYDWIRLWVYIAVQGWISMRTYMDQSLSNHKANLDAAAEPVVVLQPVKERTTVNP